ncbi:hypothetical protein BC835DRAFT_1372575 [Cytidiella melzeri]|nr:hypothetical protein BC835DRAFT_1372575 [Cytidiella melzeri]
MSQNFPTELWAHIFLMACVDGGRSACSITQVSHYFRSIMLPFQLHNVALIGPAKIAQFAKVLHDREQTPAFRRVRHLFLSNSCGAGKNPTFSKEGYEAAIRYILATTAPDLLTLTNTLPQGKVGFDNVLYVPFPKLRELTIHGPFLSPTHAEVVHLQLQPALPALEYLHILSAPENSYVYTCRGLSLKYIRFSTLVMVTPDFYNALSNVLQTDSADEGHNVSQRPSSPFNLPRGISKILIDTSIGLSRFRHILERARRRSLMTALESLERQGRLVFLDQPVYGQLAGIEREDWLDRIHGGPGCWLQHL